MSDNGVYVIECYLCNTELPDTEQHEDDWVMSNVDGANVPLCLGCEERMYEYKQEAMNEARSEE